MGDLRVLWSEYLTSGDLDDDLQSSLEKSLSLRFYGVRALGASTVAHRFYEVAGNERLLLRVAREESTADYVLQLVALDHAPASPEVIETIRASVESALAKNDLTRATTEDARSELPDTEYRVGDHVFYPHHGLGEVTKREFKKMFGEEREYLTIRVIHNAMTVMVPCDKSDVAGLRRALSEEAVRDVMRVLQNDVSDVPSARRPFKHLRDKLKSGDSIELAEVVRDLSVREREEGLSTGEEQMLAHALRLLASEIMYVLKLDEEAAANVIRKTIADRWNEAFVTT